MDKRFNLQATVIFLILSAIFIAQAGFAQPSDSLIITVKVIDSAPQGTIAINNGNPYTKSSSVTLNLSASDAESEVTQMQFSNDNQRWSEPETYAATKTWVLASDEGVKTVYVKFKDAAGNWSFVFSNTIILDTAPPQISITSPLDNAVIRPR